MSKIHVLFLLLVVLAAACQASPLANSNSRRETAGVNRGRPYKLWLELKLREDALTGSLIAFSQREMCTGPLTHWVTLRKK
jgi:hypothetical protein